MSLAILPNELLLETLPLLDRGSLVTLSTVSSRLRELSLPNIWQKQSIDIVKAEWLNDHTSFGQLIRFASILPSKFFGEISGPPTAHNQSILRLLLTRTLSSLRQLVLPFPDHVPTLQLFKSVTPDVESWRFTHVQATPALLQMVAEQRPNLRNLEYSIYPSLRPTLSLKTCEVAMNYSKALAMFPLLTRVDLCVTVHDLALPSTLDLNYPVAVTFRERQCIATAIFASQNHSLSEVTWSDPDSLDVWVWKIIRADCRLSKPQTKKETDGEAGDIEHLELEPDFDVEFLEKRSRSCGWDDVFHNFMS